MDTGVSAIVVVPRIITKTGEDAKCPETSVKKMDTTSESVDQAIDLTMALKDVSMNSDDTSTEGQKSCVVINGEVSRGDEDNGETTDSNVDSDFKITSGKGKETKNILAKNGKRTISVDTEENLDVQFHNAINKVFGTPVRGGI
jgi:hypothetical protein